MLIQGDCLIEMKTIPDGSVDLVFVDPPYNIGKAEWDKIDNYMEWCAEWIGECERVLKANGAFWISHSKPLVLAELSGMIGIGLRNWITWDKYNGNPFVQAAGTSLQAKTNYHFLRSWQVMAEYLIYHTDEGEWTSQCDKERGFIFEPLRAYLAEEKQKAGLTNKDVNYAFSEYTQKDGCLDRSVCEHYWQTSQWCLPTEEIYNNVLRPLFNRNGSEYLKRDYEDLRAEFEDLRAEFEHLRYTFNNPGKMSSVWQIPPAKATFHVTPKPEELMKRIVEATSNGGDTILDPMMGSGTTGVVCQATGREFIGIELDETYYELAKKRIKDASAQMALDL